MVKKSFCQNTGILGYEEGFFSVSWGHIFLLLIGLPVLSVLLRKSSHMAMRYILLSLLPISVFLVLCWDLWSIWSWIFLKDDMYGSIKILLYAAVQFEQCHFLKMCSLSLVCISGLLIKMRCSEMCGFISLSSIK